MGNPSLQAVQAFGLDVNGDLKTYATLRFGTPFNTENGALRTTLYGDILNSGTAPLTADQPAFVFPSDLSALTPDQLATIGVSSFNYGLDAAGVIRALPVILPTDGLDETTLYGSPRQAIGYGFNGVAGAGLDRLRTAGATNLDPTLTAHKGVQMTARIGDWGIIHAPAANNIATISKGAVAGARHVATSLTVTVSCSAAPAASVLTARLIDGASGGGNILWTGRLALQAVAGDSKSIALSGLSYVGTVNTAMTLEFIVTGANIFESVALSGFTISD